VHLKAQIALLQSSLHASHQRIVNLTSELNLSTSTSTSASGLSPGFFPTSPGAWSPGATLEGLPEAEDGSFMNATDAVEEEDVTGEAIAEPSLRTHCKPTTYVLVLLTDMVR
jgi:hypothetical protein